MLAVTWKSGTSALRKVPTINRASAPEVRAPGNRRRGNFGYRNSLNILGPKCLMKYSEDERNTIPMRLLKNSPGKITPAPICQCECRACDIGIHCGKQNCEHNRPTR